MGTTRLLVCVHMSTYYVLCVYKSANGVLLCRKLDFFSRAQEYIMECCSDKNGRYTLLWELWKLSLSVLDVLITI